MNKTLEQFAKEHELTVLAEKDQELLDEFGGGIIPDGSNMLSNCSTNNCKGGNCAAKCGNSDQSTIQPDPQH
jgi:hypothetical protein